MSSSKLWLIPETVLKNHGPAWLLTGTPPTDLYLLKRDSCKNSLGRQRVKLISNMVTVEILLGSSHKLMEEVFLFVFLCLSLFFWCGGWHYQAGSFTLDFRFDTPSQIFCSLLKSSQTAHRNPWGLLWFFGVISFSGSLVQIFHYFSNIPLLIPSYWWNETQPLSESWEYLMHPMCPI